MAGWLLFYRKISPSDLITEDVVGQGGGSDYERMRSPGTPSARRILAGPRGAEEPSMARGRLEVLDCTPRPDDGAGRDVPRLPDHRGRHVARRRDGRSVAARHRRHCGRSATTSFSSRYEGRYEVYYILNEARLDGRGLERAPEAHQERPPAPLRLRLPRPASGRSPTVRSLPERTSSNGRACRFVKSFA